MRVISAGIIVYLVGFGLWGCSSAEDGDATAGGEAEVSLVFEAMLGAKPARCGEVYNELGSTAVTGELADARLYLSQVELRNAQGEWVRLRLDTTTPWQNEEVVLLDFEDAKGACADSGNSALNSEAYGYLPEGEYDALRFQLGLPFELNHADAANAGTPLNTPGMFWSWQAGYRFARVDFKLHEQEISRWNFHLGSTGCQSLAATLAPEGLCSRPNLSLITIEGFDPRADKLKVDLGKLLAEVDLTSDTPDTAPGCMSGVGEALECTPSFAALGLAFSNGGCDEACEGQSVFSRLAR